MATQSWESQVLSHLNQTLFSVWMLWYLLFSCMLSVMFVPVLNMRENRVRTSLRLKCTPFFTVRQVEVYVFCLVHESKDLANTAIKFHTFLFLGTLWHKQILCCPQPLLIYWQPIEAKGWISFSVTEVKKSQSIRTAGKAKWKLTSQMN